LAIPDLSEKFYGDRPRGTPLSGVKRKRGSQIAILDLSTAIFFGNGARYEVSYYYY